MTERAVIVGAGQAGAQGAISLRQSGFDGEIILLGAETAIPYQRPPLSKAYLKGELSQERLYLRPLKFFQSQNITLKTAASVQEIDRASREVVTGNQKIAYDKLLLATGAVPRKIQATGADLPGIYYLRDLNDADLLRATFSCRGRVLIVGAGYIGLEYAAVARQMGCKVTVIEATSRVLSRVTNEVVSEFFARLHRDAGVDLRLDTGLTAFVGKDGRLAGVRFADGQTIDCEAALVGIGAVPESALAEQAGLEVKDGIVVDEYTQTSDKAIWAAGDCTNFPSRLYARRMRLESVPNAIEQSRVAGGNMAGGTAVYDSVPWFWSDQYDVKIQSVGICEGYDDLVVRGDPANRRFSVWALQQGRLIAVDAVNDPKVFAVSKKLVGLSDLDIAAIGDSESDLRSLVPAAV